MSFDLPAARYAPRMARFRAETAWMQVSEELRSDMVLVLAEMVAEAIEDAHLEPHQRVEVRLSWEAASARAEVRYPAAPPDVSRDSTIRNLIVSNLADAHGLSWNSGHVRRWVELHRRPAETARRAGTTSVREPRQPAAARI
jgi:hypothetical protein